MHHVTPVSASATWMSGQELTHSEIRAFRRSRVRSIAGVLISMVSVAAILVVLVQQVQKERPLTRMQFHDNGDVKLRAIYLACEKHGLWERWYANGQLMESGHFFEGRPDGCWVHYHRTGAVAKRACYDKGLYEGIVISYRKNGTIRQSEFYQKGIMTPVTPFYYPVLAKNSRRILNRF